MRPVIWSRPCFPLTRDWGSFHRNVLTRSQQHTVAQQVPTRGGRAAGVECQWGRSWRTLITPARGRDHIPRLGWPAPWVGRSRGWSVKNQTVLLSQFPGIDCRLPSVTPMTKKRAGINHMGILAGAQEQHVLRGAPSRAFLKSTSHQWAPFLACRYLYNLHNSYCYFDKTLLFW